MVLSFIIADTVLVADKPCNMLFLYKFDLFLYTS